MTDDIYSVEDYEEMDRLKDEARSEYLRELRESVLDEEYENDEEYDDGCPICGSHRCGGYCL